MKEDGDRATRLPADESRDHLMVTVARMAYHLDRTQTEIAAETGLTRWQVSKLLQEARDLGVVRIEIRPRGRRRPDIEADLIRAFGLRDAVVVPGPSENGEGLEGVAQAAGQYLTALVPRPRMVGVSWGRTMSAVAHHLPQHWNEGVDVVQINGTVALSLENGGTNNVAETFARKGRGKAIPLPVPAVVGEALTRKVLEEDRIVREVLKLARQAQVLCFSFGIASADSVLLTSGNILPSEFQRLLKLGAIGDVLGRFIDQDGHIVDPELDARTIGLSFEDLRRCERAIGITSGGSKHGIALTALRNEFVKVLITDEATAEFALDKGP